MNKMKTILYFAGITLITGLLISFFYLVLFQNNKTMMKFSPLIGVVAGVIGIFVSDKIIDRFKLY